MDSTTQTIKDFAKNSLRLVKRCQKPDSKEFWKVAKQTGLGFILTGIVGFFVKVVFIPINQIIIGSHSASSS